MPLLCNALYLVALGILSPWLIVRSLTTGRYRRNLRAKLLGSIGTIPTSTERPVWFHGVSVGEIHLLTTLVSAFRVRHPGIACVISTTTDTGYAEACKRFPDLPVILWPFDFSWAVRRTLDAVQPSMVVLAESELWPNFLRACEQRGIPVVVVNGRMSPRSFRRHGRLRWLTRPLLLGRITAFAVQSSDYRDRLTQLGIPTERLHVTGSIKYDGANTDREHRRTQDLRRLLNLSKNDRIWLAGSTHAPEEAAVLKAFVELRHRFVNLRLVLAPRSPDRFDEVCQLVERHGLSYRRRSQIQEALTDRPAVIVLDTIGELSFAWGLADIGFVGGSLEGTRGGQSMIEPAACGVPTVFGPHVWNFRDAVARLLEINGAIQIREAEALANVVGGLFADPIKMARIGEAARRMVREQQGATRRTLEVLDHVRTTSNSANQVRKTG